MPSRRISSSSNLAPRQQLAVQPYESYNSDSVNALTRMVTGEAHKDYIVNGLEVYGTSRVSEVLDPTPYIDDDFSYANQAAMEAFWDTVENFELDSNTALTVLPGGSTYVRSILGKSFSSLADSDYLNKTFKVSFDLTGEVPKSVIIAFGGDIKEYRYPAVGETYEEYLTLNTILDPYGSVQDPELKIIIDIDTDDGYTGSYCRIDNVTLEYVINEGDRVEPLRDTSINEDNIFETYLHPHEQINVTSGVCIKDEVVLDIYGNSRDSLPVVQLNYSDANSWISGTPFSVTDFPNDGTESQFSDGTAVEFDASGELVTDSLDDGESGGPRKIEGNSSESYVKWAYICVYYSYYKNRNGNHAYVGLVKEDEVEDPRYGEDFLILGKIRFIDASTADAIFYYPYRQDIGLIDATKVSYLYLNNINHWPEGRPLNVSIALDILAERTFNEKGVLFFETHQQFRDWREKNFPTGTGHGPEDYWNNKLGINKLRDFDKLAYVVDTNTWWRSHIKTEAHSSSSALEVADVDSLGNLIIEWKIIYDNEFELRWSDVNSGDWPTSGQITSNEWEWIGAKFNVNLDSQNVSELVVDDEGSGYTSAPTVTIDPPTSGTTATATAQISGAPLESITVDTGGSNYDTTDPSADITVSIGAPDVSGGVQAEAEAQISGVGLSALTVDNAGSGYTSAPTINFDSPPLAGGTKPSVTVVLDTGTVTDITITNPGSGWTSAPTLTISGGGGSGATATCTITGSPISSATVTNGGSGFVKADIDNIADAPFDAPTPLSGTTARGTPKIRGHIYDIDIVDGGSGYSTAAPTLIIGNPTEPTIAAGGRTATATCTVSAGVIDSVTITDSGDGYLDIFYDSVDASGNPASRSGTTVTADSGGTPFTAGMVGMTLIFHDGTRGGRITAFTSSNEVEVSESGSVTSVHFDIIEEPTITIVPHPSDSPTSADLVAVVGNNEVTHITITDPGSGYTTEPAFNYDGTAVSGTGVTGDGNPDYSESEIDSITITDAGTGFSSRPTVSIDTTGQTELVFNGSLDATVTYPGTINSITVDDAGSGYTDSSQFNPTVDNSGAGGTGLTLNAPTLESISGSVITGLTITVPGSGYTSAPTVTVSGGRTGGSDATLTGVIDITESVITGFTMTDNGDGYDDAPNVTISGGGGSGGRATSILSGAAITSVDVLDGGEGWTSAPTLTVDPPSSNSSIGDQAILTANISGGEIISVTVNDGGSGYKTDPRIIMSGGAGSQPSDLDEAKELFPTYYYIVRNDSVVGGYRIVNPYNPDGNGYITSPKSSEVIGKKFLRSDGLWVPSTPTGTIINWIGPITNTNLTQATEVEKAPGFLVCAGQVIREEVYPDLYELLGSLNSNTSSSSGSEDNGIRRLPDLRQLFIMGADVDDVEADQGIIGGSNSLTLTLDNMPSHDHNPSLDWANSTYPEYLTDADGEHQHTYARHYTIGHNSREYGGDYVLSGNGYQTKNTSFNGEHTHSISALENLPTDLELSISEEGNDQPFDNRPRFICLLKLIQT